MAGRFSVEAVFKAVDRVSAPVSRMQNRIGKMTRSIEAGLRRADKSLSAFTGGLLNAGKTALKFGTIGIGAITGAVTLLTREFSKIENAEAAFTPLLGGAKRAKDMVDALNNTAASTPFQFETLASSANQLLPVMNGNIEEVIKTVRMLGDTAGGDAQKLDSITRGFTKAMLTGKVSLESLNMIAEAGVPIFDDLAAVMGTKVNESFFKMISAGKVTTTQLTKAFEKMTTKGGKFFNGMEIASKTTSGLMSTLKDNISLTAAELGGVLAPVIKDIINGAIGAAQGVREWVKNNRELISSRVIAFVEKIKTEIKSLIDLVRRLNKEQDLMGRVEGLITGIAKVIKFLSEYGNIIAWVMGGIVALTAAVKVITAALTLFNLIAAMNPIGLIVLAVTALIAGFTALVVWIDDVAAGFDALPDIVRAVLFPIDLLIKSIKWVKDNIGAITDIKVPSMEDISGKISGIGSDIKSFFGFGGDDEAKSAVQPATQMVSPQERISKSIEEKKTSAEVTITDRTGTAQVANSTMGSNLKLKSTGGF